jgi:hypothetical protein
VRAGDVIENPAALMTLRVVRGAADTGGELLELEATYEPGSVEPLEHLHPSQDERFEILASTIEARFAARAERSPPATSSTSRRGRCMRCGTAARTRLGPLIRPVE